ncbi:initiator tRNA phosphoribosyl transferase [Hesseltinella vesiculosa]|uniref:Initiator tRNA phosphoribosyl transferase n=1 Tax=Hesseltinella vesiculosa TaxID=101127 RepID=A0A1X2GLY6_9FUNG|nr:initiator tRNA phosphoribosyl transferase [Hesseltinella vesiculosa]
MIRFGQELDAISKDHKRIFNRLKSIVEDAQFIDQVIDTYPSMAIISNERCGSWYINRVKHPQTFSAYFKSTDGHMGQWDFNMRRANLHLVQVITDHRGGIVVDSTRRGKRIPDALAKTVPIWCCTLNRTICRYRELQGIDSPQDWDTSFHSLPSAISRSEHVQIEARIDAFVDKFWKYNVDIAPMERLLQKPLRPFWLTPESNLSFPIECMDVYPVICVSASQFIQDGGCQGRDGYLYVQGSADDQEAWSLGLTARLFWQHHSPILQQASTCAEVVQELMARDRQERQLVQHKGEQSVDSEAWHFIEGTTLAVGDKSAVLNWTQHFDAAIQCCVDGASASNKDVVISHWLDLSIPEGKKGQHVLEKAIPDALAFAKPYLQQGKRVLVFSVDGKDRAVGVALALFVNNYDDQNVWQPAPSRKLTKESIRQKLIQLISSHPQASPSRVTLRRVNTHFLSSSAN